MNLHMQSPVGARTTFNGREVDYFAGCGYLGLQNHPSVLLAAQQALQEYGLSTATSRGGYGEHSVYAELEKQACAFFGAEKVIYFATGYLGMSILTQTTCQVNDHFFIDSQAHYSLWDAAQVTNKPLTAFPHLNPERLAEILKHELQPKERPLVLSDGVFPVSGEIAPLPDYLMAIEPYNGIVFLDDAHAVGVIGEHGRGTADYFKNENDHCRSTGTLSKALGGWGGVLWGKAGWVENIDRNSRVMAGASPPPLVMAAASARALEIARTSPDLRLQLQQNNLQAREGFRELGWKIEDSPVPIICLPARDGVDLLKIRDGLFEQGIAVEFVRSYPSSPPGGALRIAVFATHSTEQIERLLKVAAILI
jgi:8-amino-7-oxononanoate synthase